MRDGNYESIQVSPLINGVNRFKEKMISPQELRKIATEKNLPLDMLEKDYILGWVLFGVIKTTISKTLVFKGGTALSKIHFPWNWRLSEDLDFTAINVDKWDEIRNVLESDLPSILEKEGIEIKIKDDIHTNVGYLQAKLGYQGPISKGTVKIEMTKEEFVGEVVSTRVPQMYRDYPEFDVTVYSLENILAEKMRAIIQRGKIRDYYDVWRLLGENNFNKSNVRSIFSSKCEGKKIKFTGIKQFFPDNIEQQLTPYLDTLTRLKPEKLPELPIILSESHTSLNLLLSDTTINSDLKKNQKQIESELEERFGKLLVKSFAQYYGGYKSKIAGGIISLLSVGMIYIFKDYFVFKADVVQQNNYWEIIIPISSIIVNYLGHNETISSKNSTKGRVGIQDPGKNHLIIPYLDSDGILQQPEFGIMRTPAPQKAVGASSILGGGGMKNLWDVFYKTIVETHRDKSYSQSSKKK